MTHIAPMWIILEMLQEQKVFDFLKTTFRWDIWNKSLMSTGIADGFLKGPSSLQFMLTEFGLGPRVKKEKTNQPREDLQK